MAFRVLRACHRAVGLESKDYLFPKLMNTKAQPHKPSTQQHWGTPRGRQEACAASHVLFKAFEGITG